MFLSLALVSADSITGNIIREDFEVDSLLLKVSLSEGEIVEKEIKISGISDSDLTLSVENLQGVSLSERDLFLMNGESKKIPVSFDARDLSAGVYVGKLLISSGLDSASVPVIFEVESEDVFFDLNLDVSNKYSNVRPGDDFVVSLRIYDLANLGTSKADLEYYVRSIDGDLIVSESDSIVVSDESSISKTIALPMDIVEGTYVFSSVIKYKSSLGASSRFFDVSNKRFEDSGFGSLDVNLSFVLIIILVLFLMGLIIYLLRGRDEMMVELRKYNSSELQKQKYILSSQAEVLGSKEDFDRSEVDKEIKAKVKELKKKQKERVSSFKSLSKKGDKKAMKKQLNEWKKKGYYTSFLEHKLRGLSNLEMKKIIGKGFKSKI
jgi:hypothetical protein